MEEQEFKPFDKVIVRNTDNQWWEPGFYARKFNDSYYLVGCQYIYKQCHKYEDWMEKYLYTDTPFENFEK